MTQGRVISIAVFLLAVTLAGVNAAPAANLAWDESFTDGVRAYRAGDWPAAAGHLERCCSESAHAPRQRQATFYLAEVYVQLGELARARQLYESFLADMKDDPQVTVIRARFRLGEMSYLLQEDERSQRELRRFLEQHPDDELASHAARYLDDMAARRTPPLVTTPDAPQPKLETSAMPAASCFPQDVASELVSRRSAESESRRQGRNRQANREAARIKLLEAYQQDHAALTAAMETSR